MKKFSVVLILLGAAALAAGLYGWYEVLQAANSLGVEMSMATELLYMGRGMGIEEALSAGERITLFMAVNHSGLIWGGIAGIVLGVILRALNKQK